MSLYCPLDHANEHNLFDCQRSSISKVINHQSKNSTNNLNKRKKRLLNSNPIKQRTKDQSKNDYKNKETYLNELKSSNKHFNHEYHPKYYHQLDANKNTSFYSTKSNNHHLQQTNLLDSTCSSIYSSSPSSSSVNNNSNNSAFLTDGLYLLASAAVSELEKSERSSAATTSMTY